MPYIDDSTKYEFVKFKDGKEVFAMVREVFTNGQLELHFPMNINLAPAMTGGVLVHLGPYIPFTKEDSITVDSNSVLFRTSINKKFIAFYDEACSTWLDIRDNDRIDIKSSKQVWDEQKEVMEGMVKQRFERGDIDFHDDLDQMLDEFEEQEQLLLNTERGPGKDDTIH
jgi:hypothetical protein|tara:strand:- start:2432 stop:2938 length:507 start_codon:yes stop_codon:yes gene_type:complete